MERKEINIYEKLMLVTNEIGKVAKNLSVPTGSRNYKAVSESDVLEAIKPIEAKYGIASFPIDREIIKEEMLITERTYNGTTTKSNSFFVRVRAGYRFVNVDKPTEFIDFKWSYGDGIDNSDKALGKAMTYCDKYALMKFYKITTGDDPDQDVAPVVKEVIDEEKKAEVERLLMVTKVVQSDFFNFFKVKGLNEMNNKQLDDAIIALNRKLGEANEATGN